MLYILLDTDSLNRKTTVWLRQMSQVITFSSWVTYSQPLFIGISRTSIGKSNLQAHAENGKQEFWQFSKIWARAKSIKTCNSLYPRSIFSYVLSLEVLFPVQPNWKYGQCPDLKVNTKMDNPLPVTRTTLRRLIIYYLVFYKRSSFQQTKIAIGVL